MTRSQIIIIFSVLAIVGIFALIFIGVLPGLQKKPGVSAKPIKGELSLWSVGDNAAAYGTAIAIFNSSYPEVSVKTRIFDSAEEYETELLDGLAAGRGPDVFVIPNTDLARHKDKIVPAPVRRLGLFQAQALFPDIVERNFVDGGLVYALPVSIDTLALFYNQDIFNQAAVVFPPKKWSEFDDVLEKITIYDTSDPAIIARAGAAIGGSEDNVKNGADILGLLALQFGALGGTASGWSGFTSQEMKQAFDYYVSFSDSKKSRYTWNSLMPYSLDAFASGKTAMIFGYASTLPEIKKRNNALPIRVAPAPQFGGLNNAVSIANYWGYAVGRASRDPVLAWEFVIALTAQKSAGEAYSKATGMPPALKVLIDQYLEDPDLGVFAKQTLIAKSWPKTDARAADKILSDAIKSFLSGAVSSDAALYEAQGRLQEMTKRWTAR